MIEPFWTNTCTNCLDFPTLRDKFRSELSRGRQYPITLEDVRRMAADQLGFVHGEAAWFDDEISRPMLVLAALWALHTFPGIDPWDAGLFGVLVAEACGDAAFGPIEDARERKAWQIIEAMRHWNDPAETLTTLDKLTQFYFDA
jgi:hypothetical protein